MDKNTGILCSSLAAVAPSFLQSVLLDQAEKILSTVGARAQMMTLTTPYMLGMNHWVLYLVDSML